MLNIIKTSDLKLENLPDLSASWRIVSRFALTFDPTEIGDYGEKSGDLDNVSEESNIVELRSHLYVEQRRWNHFGDDPDEETMNAIKTIMKMLHEKVIS
ncbi:shikimate kinase [Lentisphaera araneosa HTCC2155]|uniref:Shikimate kinase n=1 Tax=Lentisphaera araneosa HTCC2155 TaxID=313628 RepID=A6DNT3_9BACT|nr:hypothetical protein [Lentisphaera araneosa]EDM26742.1 shikimate kinase [Lentisphaera araneosa HTCC2155]